MNGNAYDGVSQIKRMEMAFKNKSYVFDLNPEVYDFKIPNRVNVHYTKAGSIVDLFGSGLKELNIVGTTGYKGTTNDKNHGYTKFLELKRTMEGVMDDIKDGRPVKDFLLFYNHTDFDAYVTVPIRLNISRNVNQPLIYKYDIQLYVLRRVGDPVGSPTLQVVGNPLGSPNTVSQTVNDRDIVEKGDEADTKFSQVNKDETKESKKENKKTIIISKGPTVRTGRNINSRS